MVLKGLNWVHNDKIGSNGLKRSQLGTQYKYRGYLLRQVVFHFTEKSMDLSVWCCPFEGWVGNVVFVVSEIKSVWKLRFSSKSVVFIKIQGFCQNLRFSSKSVIFVKIRDFLPFLSELSRGQHQMWNERPLPRNVIPIFVFAIATSLTNGYHCLLWCYSHWLAQTLIYKNAPDHRTLISQS